MRSVAHFRLVLGSFDRPQVRKDGSNAKIINEIGEGCKRRSTVRVEIVRRCVRLAAMVDQGEAYVPTDGL